jgi:hypothetical protein
MEIKRARNVIKILRQPKTKVVKTEYMKRQIILK